ncbi:MAG: UDP-N-acetylmuramate dehydrogenase [bacterium]|nr:UDP-N-acetylmuramate dehydrogenase [bacterium]
MDAAALEALLKESSAPKGPETGWDFKLEAWAHGEVKLHEPLKRYTSIQIGGPADALVFPKDKEDLSRILHFAKENRVPWTVLGLGSNVLVRDGGIRGIVFRLNKTLSDWKIVEETGDRVLVEAGAGVPLPKIVEAGRQGGWQGIASLYGIPGSVGGALWMNAGTREGEIKDVVQSIRVMLSDGTVEEIPAEKLKFEYRHLKLPSRGIILSGVFSFAKGKAEEVQQALNDFQQKRRDTQPLDQASLGSVFKNPEKGFAAQIIEELGLKGVRVGGARISDKHANFIVNEREATAKDVLALMGLVKDRVREELDIKLELEAKVLGEDESL